MRAEKIAEIAIWIGATQKLKELRKLVMLAQRRSLKRVLEIGTWRGGTLWMWCKLAEPDASIVSLDLPGGKFGGGYSRKDMERYRLFSGPGQALSFVRKDSHLPKTKAEVEKSFKGAALDLLFIDGDHSYQGVKKDFEDYAPLVKKGGLIVFHDILHHPRFPDCEVERFWKEVKKAGYRTWEFTEPEDDRGWGQWGGIGVLEYVPDLHCSASRQSGIRRKPRSKNS